MPEVSQADQTGARWIPQRGRRPPSANSRSLAPCTRHFHSSSPSRTPQMLPSLSPSRPAAAAPSRSSQRGAHRRPPPGPHWSRLPRLALECPGGPRGRSLPGTACLSTSRGRSSLGPLRNLIMHPDGDHSKARPQRADPSGPQHVLQRRPGAIRSRPAHTLLKGLINIPSLMPHHRTLAYLQACCPFQPRNPPILQSCNSPPTLNPTSSSKPGDVPRHTPIIHEGGMGS
jgi:hypothetical protein